MPTDVTDSEGVAAGFERVREAFGPVEVLVLNQAARGGGPFAETTSEEFERTWRVRAFGSFLCVRAALSDLRETRGTVIYCRSEVFVQPPSQNLAATTESA